MPDLSRTFERSLGRFAVHIGMIALEEGFAINYRRTRAMRQGFRRITHVVSLKPARGERLRALFDRIA